MFTITVNNIVAQLNNTRWERNSIVKVNSQVAVLHVAFDNLSFKPASGRN